ncbi:MAG: hypothetical protein ACYDHT_09085 [Solirubrobacteraceae bacterium]
MPTARSTLALSLTAAAAVLGACGSSTSSPSPSAPSSQPASSISIASTATASTPAPPHRRPHAQFASFAKAVNLRPQDVPGFRVAPKKARRGRAHNAAFEDDTAYRRCFHVAKEAKPLFKASSSRFEAGSDLHLRQVSSKVEVEPSLATARRELLEARKAIHSRSARKCFAREFDALGTQGKPIHVGTGSVRVFVGNLRLVPFSVSAATHGTGGGFGFSLSARVTYVAHVRGRTFKHRSSVEYDTLGFLLGRAGVKLDAVTLGSSFSPRLEAELLSRLVSRAIEAGLDNPAITR